MVDNFSAPAPMAPRLGKRQRLALGALGASFLMVAVDSTIVYVAIPSIQRGLGLSTVTVQWLMSAFLLSFGGMLLLSTRLADLFGRRRLFTTGLAVVAAASLLSAVAWSGGALIAARALQGVGAALVATTALPLLALSLGNGPARSRALGLWTLIGAFGGTAGLLLGGILTDGPGWRWVFLLNVPVGIAAALLAPVLPADRCALPGRPLDVAGAASLVGALVLFGWTIVGAFATEGSAVNALLRLAGAVVLLLLFLAVESRAARPLVRPGLLRSRTRLAGLIVLFTAGTIVDGVLLLITLYGQESLGLSATGFGVLMVALTLPSVIGSYAGQAVVLRHGLRTVAMAGMALVGAGLLALTMVRGPLAAGYIVSVLPVIGVGAGAAFVAAQIAVTLGATDADSSATTGLTDASFSMGGAIGLAIVSAALVAHQAAPGAPAAPGQVAAGLQTAFAVAAGLAVIGLLAALVLLRRGGNHLPIRRFDP
ncbi:MULTISPECIES: MFS transporter [unclassified Micromonospora]|uniref:MFS transporter n=1 Tax=unclassified Micromonospora TaxID=2617518 RepID=UPI001788DC3E|nr:MULTISPECIES: MFS transporter [unclassified Micromonospora]MDG4758563.1 MFS transporter [Micromonospora sp. WMMD710]